MARKKNAHFIGVAGRVGLLFVALGCLQVANAQSYQVGQYLGNLNEAGRFAYNTMGGAAQYATHSSPATYSGLANGVRMSAQASATIGGRAVPLTLLSRIPTGAIVTAARGLSLANPLVAAGTLLGFAAMNGWLTNAELKWNPDPATNGEKPFLSTRQTFDCVVTPEDGAMWEAAYRSELRQYDNPAITSRKEISTNHGGSISAGMCRLEVNTYASGAWSHMAYRHEVPRIAQVLDTPITWDEAVPKLGEVAPPDPSIIPKLLEKGASFPQPVDQTASGPASQQGEKTTRQNADGTKTTTTTTHNYNYNQGNTTNNTSTNITHNTTTTTVVTNTNNEVVSEETETTENKPEEEKQDFCKQNPDSLACKVFEADTPEGEIPREQKEVTYQAESVLGGGSCPANKSMMVGGQFITVWDWQATCQDIVRYVKPVIIAICGFIALVILVPGGRGEL